MNFLALHVVPLATEPEGWLRGVPFMMLQTFLLMSAAYFLGAFIGCMWRRVIHTAPDLSDVRSTETAVAATAAPAAPVAARVATGQPEVEYVAPKSGVSDATRFERALSGAGTLTPAVTPPPKPAAPAVAVSTPAAAPAPVTVEAPKPVAATPVETPAKPAAPAPVVPAKPIDTEPPTVISQTRPMARSAPIGSDAVSVAAAVAAAAAASAAMKASARSAEVVKAPEPVAPKPVQPTVTVRPSPPVTSKPADPPNLRGVPAASGGGMSGAVADVRVQAGPPADRQDLTLVRGIDEAAQRLLNARGIWRYADIVRWTQTDVDAVNAAMTAPRRVEHQGWIEQAAVLAAGGSTEYSRRRAKGDFASVAAAPGAQIAARPIVAGPPVPTVAPSVAAKPEPQDLTLIRGIDEAMQRRLNDSGVWRFADIARWKQGDVDAVNSALSEPRRVESQGWIEQAAVLASGGLTDFARRRMAGEVGHAAKAVAVTSAAKPQAPQVAAVGSAPAPASDPQDLTLIRGIDEAMQRRLNDNGVWRFADIARWKQADVDAVNSALSEPRRVESQGWIEQAAVLASGGLTDFARRRKAGEVGNAAKAAAVASAAKPQAPQVAAPVASAPASASDPQDLTLIRGIDNATARLLNDRGIWRYSDIARWGQTDVDQLNQAMATPRRVEHEGWIEQASVLAAGNFTDYARRRLRGEQSASHEAVVRAPVRAPAVATSPAPAAAPSVPPVAERSPSIAANAVAAAIAAAAASASRGGAASDRIPSAPAAAPPAAPAAVRVTAAAPVTAPASPPPAASAPVAPARPAAPSSDMLQRIRGIDAGTERLLNSNGITRFRQIASWTPADVEQADAMLASPGRVQRENWIEQAGILAGEPADTASRPARLADAIRENSDRTPRTSRADVGALRSVRSEALKPATAEAGRTIGGARPYGPGEDLKRIRGIGVLIEKKLNALGVSTYDQIANWTVTDIERVSEQLDFRGRIERENWIEQARILSAGGQTEFSRRLDRGEIQ